MQYQNRAIGHIEHKKRVELPPPDFCGDLGQKTERKCQIVWLLRLQR